MPKKLVKSDNYSRVFNNLIDICDKKGTTITSLIDKFSNSRSAMTAWKNGNINIDLIPKIVQELDISYEELFSDKRNSSSTKLSDDGMELLGYYEKLDKYNKGKIVGEAKALYNHAHASIPITKSKGITEPFKISPAIKLDEAGNLLLLNEGKVIANSDLPDGTVVVEVISKNNTPIATVAGIGKKTAKNKK